MFDDAAKLLKVGCLFLKSFSNILGSSDIGVIWHT